MSVAPVEACVGHDRVVVPHTRLYGPVLFAADVDPLMRTWARWHARGCDTSHVNPMICTWAAPPTRTSRGLRAYQGVDAHIQRFACDQHARPGTVVPKTQTTSAATPHFQCFSTRWSASWAPYRPEP